MSSANASCEIWLSVNMNATCFPSTPPSLHGSANGSCCLLNFSVLAGAHFLACSLSHTNRSQINFMAFVPRISPSPYYSLARC